MQTAENRVRITLMPKVAQVAGCSPQARRRRHNVFVEHKPHDNQNNKYQIGSRIGIENVFEEIAPYTTAGKRIAEQKRDLGTCIQRNGIRRMNNALDIKIATPGARKLIAVPEIV